MIARCSAALAVAAVLVAAPARAQGLGEADRAAARSLAQQGQDALDARDFAAAADRFARAEAIIRRAPTLLVGQARAQVGLGKLLAAQEIYANILRDGVPRGAPGVFHEALRDAKRELGALSARIPAVIVTVSGAASPRVSLDGAPLDTLGAPRLVDPGTHVIRAEADGLAPAEVTVTVAERRTEPVSLVLGQPAPKPVEAASSGAVLRPLGFAALGVGVAGLAVGIGTGVVAMGKHADLTRTCPTGRCFGQSSAISSYHAMTTTSTVGFVVGGALAAAGVILVAVTPSGKRANDAWITPLVGPLQLGAAGRF